MKRRPRANRRAPKGRARLARRVAKRHAPVTAADVAKRIRGMIRRHAARLNRVVNANPKGFAAADIAAGFGADSAALTAYLASAKTLGTVPTPAVPAANPAPAEAAPKT